MGIFLEEFHGLGSFLLARQGGQILHEIAKLVRHSHERWDVDGYPNGLEGDQIPLGSRIIAVADAYDAMINDRPYKQAISHEQAIAELRRHAGTQFDPELVELFCALYADHAPEPDQAVLAMTAGGTGHGAGRLVLPEQATSRPVRKRRQVDEGDDERPTAESRTMAADGSIGIAPPGPQVVPTFPPASPPSGSATRGRRTDSAAG